MPQEARTFLEEIASKPLTGGLMKRLASIGGFVLVALMTLASLAKADEKDVLKALEKIKCGVEEEVRYEKYAELVREAKVEIDRLQPSKEVDKEGCFLNSINECYQNYENARTLWNQKIEARTDHEEYKKEFMGPAVTTPKYFEKLEKHVRLTNRIIGSCEEGMQDSWSKAQENLDRAYKCLE
jgi:hypothetical protein